MAPHPEPFFLSLGEGALGQRFALHHAPQAGTPRGLVVYVHPFAEEMNKSRRMAALQSRALAAAGFAVLQMDLLGCGDSGGDFGDATWATWVDDVVQACGWLRQRHAPPAGHDVPPLWLWGLRVGALLAAEASQRIDTPAQGLLLWQPLITGSTALQQFLRLHVAGELLGGRAKGAMAEMRRRLAAGDALDIAGYRLHPALAKGLEHAALNVPAPTARVEWLELVAGDDAALSPVVQRVIKAFTQAGCVVRTHAVRGPSFWQTTEIEDAPALIAATLAAMRAEARTEALA